MGYMTEVSILNDRWDEIRKSPVEFVEQLYASSMSGGRLPYQVIGQTEVAKTHHADDIRIYFSGRNLFFDVYPKKGWNLDQLNDHLSYLAEARTYLNMAEQATKRDIAKGGD